MTYPGDYTCTFEDYSQFNPWPACGFTGDSPQKQAHTREQSFPIDTSVRRTGNASMRYMSWSKDEGGYDPTTTSVMRLYQFPAVEGHTPADPKAYIRDKPGDEVWWAWSLRFPDTGTYMFEIPPAFAGWFITHRSYWAPMGFEVTGGLTALRMEYGGGRIVSPAEHDAGLYGDYGGIGSQSDPPNNILALKANDPERRANGLHAWQNLLGDGAPRPFTKNVWHDFIMHVKWEAYGNGILEIKHREEGGPWALLYSNVPGAGAVIQHAPHPTLQWNTQHGANGEPGHQYDPSRTAVYVDYQMYRNPSSGTWGMWCDNLLRRQTEQEILAYLPGSVQPKVRVVSETATTINLGWDPVPGADGYRFTSEKQAKPSHTWDGSRTTVRFAKGSAWYKVEALDATVVGEYRP